MWSAEVRIRLALAVAALALAGCSTAVPGSPGAERAADAPSSTTAARDPDDACTVAIARRGAVRVSGGSSRVVTRNGATSLSCAGGSTLAVDEVAGGAVTLSAEDGPPVRIAAGETAEVAEYEVTVESVDGDAAEFVVVPS